MATASKFLFETNFEPGAAVPKPLAKKNFNAAEMEAACLAAEQVGHAAGRTAAIKEVEARTAVALETLASRLADDLAKIHERHAAQLRDTLAAAGEMTRRLFPALAERHEFGEIEALFADCVARLNEEPRLLVRAPETLVDALKPRLDRVAERAGYAGRVILIGDPALRDGQTRIEWADGGVDRDSTRLWAEIDTALQRYLTGSAPAGTTGA